MADYLNRLRHFSRDVRLFLVTPALIGLTVFGGIYTVLFNLYLARLGYGPTFIGLVNASGQFALAVFALPASAIGSWLGIRRTMLTGLTLGLLGYGLPMVGESLPTAWRDGWILGAYLSGGLGMALYFVNSSPWVMAVAKPEERGHIFSVQAALWPSAGFVGSLIGGVLPSFFAWTLGLPLDSPAPYRYPLLLAAGLLIFGVITLAQTQEVTVGRTTAMHSPQDRAAALTVILVIALVGVLRGSGEGAARTFFNLYMDTELGASAAQIGAFLAVGQLLSTPAALITPILAARWGNDRAITFGTLGLALTLVPLGLVTEWWLAGASFMAMLVLIAVARPAYMLYSQELAAPHWQGAMSAATTMSIGLSWAIMAFGGGYVIALVGYRALFLAGAVLTACGALLFWSYFRLPRGEFARRVRILQ